MAVTSVVGTRAAQGMVPEGAAALAASQRCPGGKGFSSGKQPHTACRLTKLKPAHTTGFKRYHIIFHDVFEHFQELSTSLLQPPSPGAAHSIVPPQQNGGYGQSYHTPSNVKLKFVCRRATLPSATEKAALQGQSSRALAHSFRTRQPEESSWSSVSPSSSHLPCPFMLEASEERTVL